MKTYRFTIIIAGDDLTVESSDAYFDAGCDDASFSTLAGVTLAEFDRRAPSYIEAVTSAIHDLEKANARVVRIEPDDLVTAAEIAERSGRTRESVRLLIVGQRGPGDFPPPAMMRDRNRLWRWSEVAGWLARHAGTTPVGTHEAMATTALNAWLTLRVAWQDLDESERELVRNL